MYGQEGSGRAEPYATRTDSDPTTGPISGPTDGFFRSLFDFSFSHFVTPKLVRLAYILAVIGAGVLGAVGLLVGLARGGVTAVAALIFIPLVFLAWAAFVRIILEIFIVVFRIAEPVRDAAVSLQELKRLAEKSGRLSVETPGSGSGSGMTGPVSGEPSSPASSREARTVVEGDDSGSPPPKSEPGSTFGRSIAPEGYRFCVECGAENMAENRFCFSCGANLRSVG